MKMVAIKRLCTTDIGFDQDLKNLVAWDDQLDANVHLTVKEILQEITKNLQLAQEFNLEL